MCSSIDIRNTVDQFSQLENCTVIEGSLHIVLIENAESSDYKNLSFPKLKEITDYFMLWRVKSLLSLAQIFPNLMVIRGSKLLDNFALVIYEMFELQEIVLPSLRHILRGAVRIAKNPKLCYVDSIDWNKIAPHAEKSNYLMDNGKSDECPNSCPENCPLGKQRCWSKNVCQTSKSIFHLFLSGRTSTFQEMQVAGN